MVDNLFSIIWWSSVSNAAERSRKAVMDVSLPSMLESKLLVTTSRAVSVLWSQRYADWRISSIPLSQRCFCSCRGMTISKIFETNGRLKTGLLCFNKSWRDMLINSTAKAAAANKISQKPWIIQWVKSTNRKQRWLQAFKKTNQNTQEVTNECFLIWTRQNNVWIFGIRCKATNGQTDHSKLDLCYGGSFSTAIFNSDIPLRFASFSRVIYCFPFVALLKATYAENSHIV